MKEKSSKKYFIYYIFIHDRFIHIRISSSFKTKKEKEKRKKKEKSELPDLNWGPIGFYDMSPLQPTALPTELSSDVNTVFSIYFY